jgi:hypothetical protein
MALSSSVPSTPNTVAEISAPPQERIDRADARAGATKISKIGRQTVKALHNGG